MRPLTPLRNLSAALWLLGSPLAADAAGMDQDFARDARQSGRAMPYAAVQERVARLCNCRVLEAGLHEEKDDGRRFLIYEIKAIAPDGSIVKLEMDANTGAVIKMKRKDHHD